ncbi:MAG: TonB family protein [Gammaproteobacteria bacterium]|nr:TonB family protein [Gammaproteobacteria bacterium]
MGSFYYLDPKLPWEVSEEESSRFRKILTTILILCLLFGVVVPFIPVPEDVRVINKVPDRLVKLVIEQKKVVIPPKPPEPVKKEEKPEEKKPEEKKPEEKPKEKPEPKPEPKPQPKPQPKPEPQKPAKTAKQAAEEKAAVFDMFSDVTNDSTADELTGQQDLIKSGSSQTQTQREIIGDAATRDSGGINVAKASKTQGRNEKLAGSGTTTVTSKIKGVEAKKQAATKSGAGGVRTSENIQLTFDKNQGRIFTAYNRALRKDPSLRGTVVFKLTIQPSGVVSDVSVVRSELNSPDLEKRLVSAIKRLNFGAQSVGVWTGNYPVVFAPQ